MLSNGEKLLVKQFLFRLRQQGYTIIENPSLIMGKDINIDIYKGESKICTLDDCNLGEWHLQLRNHITDGTFSYDYKNLLDMFYPLSELYMIYDKAVPLDGYDYSLEFKTILEHNNHMLAIKSNRLGELEFGSFQVEKRNNYNSIANIKHFDMNGYILAKLDFVSRSGLIPIEHLITHDNIQYLYGACSKVMMKEGQLLNDNTKNEFKGIISNLEVAQDTFRYIQVCETDIHAKRTSYIDTRIFGVKGLFTKRQVDRSTIPKGYYAYNITHSEHLIPNKIWCEVRNSRLFGTVITSKPLVFEGKGAVLKENDLKLNPEKHLLLSEFKNRCDKPKKQEPER